MPAFRGPSAMQAATTSYAGVPGADLANAPQGPVPFTSPIGLPVTRLKMWAAGGMEPGVDNGGVPGRPLQRAYGNPSRMGYQDNVDPNPYGGDEDNSPGLSQFGTWRPLRQSQESAIRAPGDMPVGYSNDKLITYDRHGMFKVGYENSGRNSGVTDPPMDGPARPSLWLVQRTVNYQQGTDTTAATDDLNRDYSRNAEGMYVGEQGSGWAPVYGGTPGLHQAYGSYQGIAPDTPGYDPETGTAEGVYAPVPIATPGDGTQAVWSGPPHGLHSPTLPVYSQTIGRYMSIPQQIAPRIDRPSNSPIAGQSFSQIIQPQGQTGTVAQNRQSSSGVSFMRGAVGANVSFGSSVGWRGSASV